MAEQVVMASKTSGQATAVSAPKRSAVAVAAAGRLSALSAASAATAGAKASTAAPGPRQAPVSSRDRPNPGAKAGGPTPEMFSVSVGDEVQSKAAVPSDGHSTGQDPGVQTAGRGPQMFSLSVDDEEALINSGLNEDELREYHEIEASFERFKARQNDVERNVAELLDRLNTRIHVPSSVASSECGDMTSMTSSEWDTESLGPTEDSLSMFGSLVGSRAGTPPRSPLGSPRELKPLHRFPGSSSSGATWPPQDWHTPQKASNDFGSLFGETSRPMSTGFSGTTASDRYGTNPLGGERGDLLSERSGGPCTVTSSMNKATFSPAPRLTSQLLAARSGSPMEDHVREVAPAPGADHAQSSSSIPLKAVESGTARPVLEEVPVAKQGAEDGNRFSAPVSLGGGGTLDEEEELQRWHGWTVVATTEGRLFFYNEQNQVSQWHQPAELQEVLGVWVEIPDPQADGEGEKRGSYWRNELLRISLWKDPRTTTNLFQAALDGNIFFMQLYLEADGQLDVVDPKGRSALHYACAGGATQSVLLLLQRKAEVDRCDEMGATPLIFACRYGYAPVVKVLLDANASVNLCGEGNSTPLHEAASMGQVDCLHLLLLSGANVALVNSDKETSVDVAAKKRHYTCVTLLRLHLQNPINQQNRALRADAAARLSGGTAPSVGASSSAVASRQTVSSGREPAAAVDAVPQEHLSHASAPPAVEATAVVEGPEQNDGGDAPSGDESSDLFTDAGDDKQDRRDGSQSPSTSKSSERSPIGVGLMQSLSRFFGGSRRRSSQADLGKANAYMFNRETQRWEIAEDD
eukprot:TRINITY_DN34760_c1_g2_i2.p1 TRINITY_DN34760_c1_g2~~TRINITY_DN34760_c1_g2_i2.p1  ORF type:complete len:839 (+),score=144.73 TRINITY_DN34760_c1_g2_i2:100-2517(+)